MTHFFNFWQIISNIFLRRSFIGNVITSFMNLNSIRCFINEWNLSILHFVYEAGDICNLFLLLPVNNLTVEEGNKLKNWCDILIVVTKFGIETTNYYTGANSFFDHIYYIIITYVSVYQPWDICVLIRFIYHFWSIINKRGCCIKNFLVCVFFKKSWLRGRALTVSHYISIGIISLYSFLIVVDNNVLLIAFLLVCIILYLLLILILHRLVSIIFFVLYLPHPVSSLLARVSLRAFIMLSSSLASLLSLPFSDFNVWPCFLI